MTTDEQVATLDAVTDKIIAGLHENGRDLDDDDRALIWNTLSRTLLALVREPVASVTATVIDVGMFNWCSLDVQGQRLTLMVPDARSGSKVRIDVHAVDAGEEK